jgi:type VI secretion system protein ImpE
MNASDFFKAGQLPQAVDAQLKEVKAHPQDHGKRLFLFELLAFAGDLDRARKQLDVVKYDSVEQEAAVQQYRKLLDSEGLRRRLFRDSLQPEFFGEPPGHVRHRLEAVNRLREGRATEAAELLSKANAEAPSLSGTLNGKAFEGLRDCDDLFGTVLEVMAHGHYYWVPLEQVEAVAAKAPRFARDLLWLPARLDLRDGATGEVFLPALYPGSHEHADAQVKLGRASDYSGGDGSPVRGAGQREFLAGDDAVGLLEWRELQIQPPAA